LRKSDLILEKKGGGGKIGKLKAKEGGRRKLFIDTATGKGEFFRRQIKA